MSKHTPGPWHVEKEWNTIKTPQNETLRVVGVAITSSNSPEYLANAHLIAAAPELLEAQTMGAQINTPDFLDWMADRLVNVYKENPNIDFVLTLRSRAAAGRAAIAKALNQTEPK